MNMYGVFRHATVVLAVAAAWLALAISAHAATLTFDFTGGGGQQAPTMIFTKNSVVLTVSSHTFTTNSAGTLATLTTEGKVGRWQDGLGIVDGQRGDQHYVDGSGRNDVLSFYFSVPVKILSLTFSYNDSNDNFAFFFDDDKNGNLTNDLVWKNRDIPGSSFYGTYTFAAFSPVTYIGRLFGVGAFDDNDEFKLASISVATIPTSAVPVPGALPLLLSGLAAFGWFGRRRVNKAH
jgi:hypothetical protein